MQEIWIFLYIFELDEGRFWQTAEGDFDGGRFVLNFFVRLWMIFEKEI